MTILNKKQLLTSTVFISATLISVPAYAVCTPGVGTNGNDVITCTGNDGTINANDGDDIVNIADGARVTGTVFLDSGNSESGNDTLNMLSNGHIGSVQGQNGNDTINILGGSEAENNVDGGRGSDTITVTDSFIGRDGNVWNGGSVVAGLNSHDATSIDTILITNSGVDGRVETGAGNDVIRITGGSSIRDNVEGNDGADMITIDGSFIGRDPQTGNMNAGSVIGGTNTNDDGADIITITGSTIDGDVQGGGAGDTITITGSTIDRSVEGGTNTQNDGDDTIMITGTTVGRNVTGGAGADMITATDSSIGGFVNTGNVSNFDGADTVTLTNTPVDQNITTGSGGDTVTVTGGSVGTFILLGSEDNDDGADTLTMTGSSVGTNIRTGRGDDTVNLTNTPVGTYIDTGNGADTITVTGGSVGSYIDAGDLNQNDGADTITLTGTMVDGRVDSGAAGDMIVIDNTTVNGQVTAGTNSNLDGDDTVMIVNGSVTEDVLTGDGNDTLTITGSTVGNDALGTQGVDLGDGDDTINLAGTVNGFVDLGNGNDAITLNDGTIINTTSNYTVTGQAGDDTIIINGGTYTGINAGTDNDTITMNGGTISEIFASSGDDVINLYGGTITDADGLRAGSGDDTLVVDNAMSATALDLTAITRFDGDGGTDTATFRNVSSGTHVADNVSFTQWDSVTFENSMINLDNSTFINFVNLTSGTTLTQVDGNLNLGGGTVLTVDGTSRVNLQDGVTDDIIRAIYNPAAGSVLAVDVDVVARGYVQDDSDYIVGTSHMPTSGALIDANVIGAAGLSGSRRIVSGGRVVQDPGIGATLDPSSTYQLVNDPSTGSRRFWLQDDGEGGVFLVWTTPVSGATASAFFGGGAVIAGTNPTDRDFAIDPNQAGAGAADILMNAGAFNAMNTIGDMAANGAMPAGQSAASKGAQNPAASRSSRDGSYTSCGRSNKLNAWVSGSLASSSFGTTDGNGQNASFGIEHDLGDLFEANCGRVAIGAFAYLGSSDLEMDFGSSSDISSKGFGGYLRGSTDNGFYGSVSAHSGTNDVTNVNGILESNSEYDTKTAGVALAVGKVTSLGADLNLDLRGQAYFGDSDTSEFTDSNDLTISSIGGSSKIYSGTVGIDKGFADNLRVHGRAGVKKTDIDNTLRAYGIPVQSQPSYTTATGEIGFGGLLGEKAHVEISGFGETGSDLEIYGAKAKVSVRF